MDIGLPIIMTIGLLLIAVITKTGSASVLHFLFTIQVKVIKFDNT